MLNSSIYFFFILSLTCRSAPWGQIVYQAQCLAYNSYPINIGWMNEWFYPFKDGRILCKASRQVPYTPHLPSNVVLVDSEKVFWCSKPLKYMKKSTTPSMQCSYCLCYRSSTLGPSRSFHLCGKSSHFFGQFTPCLLARNSQRRW